MLICQFLFLIGRPSFYASTLTVIFADSIEKCAAYTDRVVATRIALGFTINWEKSIRLPGVSIEYLGFVFDSQQMK